MPRTRKTTSAKNNHVVSVEATGATVREVLERLHSRVALVTSLLDKLVSISGSCELGADDVIHLSDVLNETVEDVQRLLDAPAKTLDQALPAWIGA